MNPLLARQLVEAARQRADGQPDLDRLCALVSDSYDSLSASHGEDPVEAAAVAHAGLDLQTLLDNLADAMLAVDDQGLVRLSNKSAAALFHCDPAQLLHAHIFDLLPPAEVGEVGQFLEKLAESSHAPGQSCELDARRDDGERFRVALKVSDVLISGERRFVVSLRDISRRLQRQQELADSEARFRTLVENAPEAIIVFDADERVIVDTNANARALLDLDNLQPGTQSLVEISAPLQRDGVRAELASVEYFARAMAGEAPSFEWRFQRPGQQIDFDAEVRYVRLPGSQRNLIRASITDVSERLRETRSARLTAQFERLLSDLCAGMLDDRDGEAGAAVVDCLRRLSEFGGVCRSRIFQFTTNPADRTDLAECTHAWGEIAVDGNGQGQRLLIDTELPWLSARIRQLDVFDVPSVTGLPGEAGRERRYFEDAGVSSLVAVPMTIGGRLAGFMLLESQQTEGHWPEEILGRLRLVADICGAELRRKTTAAAQARLMAVLNATPDLVVLCDRAGVLLQANDAAREQLGLDEFGNGKMLADLFAEGDEVTGEGLPTAIRDGSWRSEASWQLGDGRQVLVSQITLAHRDGSGSIEYFSTIARDISERAAVAAQLRNSEQNLLMALSAAGMVTWSWNIDDGQMNWSEQVDEFFGARGYRFGSHIDSYLATVHKDDRAELQRGIARALSSGAADLHSEHRILNEDARSSWVEFQGCIERDDSGQPCRMVGTTCDISARKRAEMALCEEKERALVTLDSIADAVVTTDEHGLIQTLNRAAEQRLDIAAASVAGLSIDELFTLISDENGNPVDNPVMQCLEEGRTIEAKTGLVLRASNGAEFAVQFSSAPIRNTQGLVMGAVMVFHDVSIERSLYQRLSYQARHDGLTGLINRRELEDRLSDTIRATWQDGEQEHCLLYLDLDQFKVINDTCGHSAGDELLKRVAAIVQEQIRAADHLARLGGDEFCVLLVDCPQDRGEQIAENVRRAVNDFRFIWQDRTFSVSASIGLVRIDSRSENLASTLSAADVACYAAKDGGRNRVSVYRGEAALIQHREMQWVSRITQACEDDRLVLFSHPIVPLERGAGHRHYELLLRMRDPYGKLVPPNSFIPAAERYNLMPMIDRWVARHALTQLAQRVDDDPDHPYTLSINLSGSSLSDPDFLGFLTRLLQQTELAPESVCFEITETSAITNLDEVVAFMTALRELGCLFSLDDFGSGLSSFAYLKDLPVNFLKIDRHFVRNIVDDVVDRSMVAAINQVGHVMGLRTIAEGVETRAVLETLRTAGIDLVQGFLFGEPVEIRGRADFRATERGNVVPLVG